MPGPKLIVRDPMPFAETANVPPVIAVVPVLTVEPLEILSSSVLTLGSGSNPVKPSGRL